jgi:hypothetical protein
VINQGRQSGNHSFITHYSYQTSYS